MYVDEERIVSSVQDIVSELDGRRKELRMSYAVVAKFAGVSLRTTQRLLSGEAEDVRLSTLSGIGRAMGVTVRLAATCGARAFRRKQARRKAERLVGLAQGSAALEGQAVPKKELEKIIQRVADELAVGKGIRLWGKS